MKNFGEFFNNQIEHAGTIILSRTQNINEEKLNKAIEMIRSLNQNAHIITTAWDDLEGAQILAAMENVTNLELEMLAEQAEKEHAAHEHHHHEHDGECGCEHHGHGHHHHEYDEECGCEHHEHGHHHHHADEVFTSWGVETPNKYEKTALQEILNKLANTDEYGNILRSKGMVPASDGTWLYFDLVPQEYEIREGKPDFTGRICVIGEKLQEDKLKELFSC